MKHTIEILHTKGCKGAPQAEETARLVAAQRGDVVVTIALVDAPAEALRLGMRGSPTVLVDGHDVDPGSSIPIGAMA